MKNIIILSVIFLQAFHFANGQNLAPQIENIALNNDMMGGAVLVFCESEVIESHYFGKADYQRNFDVSENTKFRIASISKTITAIAIMQLVELNLLDLEADITSILGYNVQNPNYPNVGITPRMLLSHTSTIIDGPTYSSFLSATVNNSPIPNLNELLTPTGSFYSGSQFNNTVPGSYFNYSNVNYVILGTIVEKVADLRFDVYCTQNIFQPLGLDASFNVNDLESIDSVAVLYRKIDNIWTPQVDDFQGIQPVFTNLVGYLPGTNGGRFGPQGGLRCSAQDLATIFMCLNDPEFCPTPLLNPTSTASMSAENWSYNGSNGNNYYGLFLSWGLGIHRITSTLGNDIVLPESSSMFGHTGEAYGLVSDAYYDTTRKVGFVFITNGVGVGYQTNDYSVFYTVEQEIFDAIENYGNLQSCVSLNIDSELVDWNQFTVYPNPVSFVINLDYKMFKNPTLLRVYDLDGKIVMKTMVNSALSTLDVSHLESGIYAVQIDTQVKCFVKY